MIPITLPAKNPVHRVLASPTHTSSSYIHLPSTFKDPNQKIPWTLQYLSCYTSNLKLSPTIFSAHFDQTPHHSR